MTADHRPAPPHHVRRAVHVPPQRTPRHRSVRPAWTESGLLLHREKVGRALAFLVGMTTARRDYADVDAELADVRVLLAEARQRADQGRELAELLHRERHLTGLLLADDDMADAETEALAMRTREAS